MPRALRLLLLVFLLELAAAPAHAHKPSDSYLTLDATGSQVAGQWDIALRDLDFVLHLDRNNDGALTWEEVRSRHADIATYALGGLELAAGGEACTLSAQEQLVDHHTDGAYTVLRFNAACQRPASELAIGYHLFAEVDPQHRGLVQLRHAGNTVSAIFGPDNPRQSLRLQTPDSVGQLLDYARHGVRHIWIGFDHILFLLSLLLPAVVAPPGTKAQRTFGQAFFDVFKVVTAFTLAHSLTLALASLQVVELPSRLVESAIAASVALAALNNIFPLLRGRRALAAFAFGLVHGFGFAGVLAGLGLPQQSMLLGLFGFNAGVELGQLAIVALVLPAAFLVRATRFYHHLLTSGSALIVLVSVVWFVERALDLRVISV